MEEYRERVLRAFNDRAFLLGATSFPFPDEEIAAETGIDIASLRAAVNSLCDEGRIGCLNLSDHSQVYHFHPDDERGRSLERRALFWETGE